MGSEYKGKYTTALFKKYDIKQYSVYNSRTKCSIAERAIRTVKGKIYRHFTQQQTNNYIDILADLQKGYNLSQHRGLCNNTPNIVDAMLDKNESGYRLFLPHDSLAYFTQDANK